MDRYGILAILSLLLVTFSFWGAFIIPPAFFQTFYAQSLVLIFSIHIIGGILGLIVAIKSKKYSLGNILGWLVVALFVLEVIAFSNFAYSWSHGTWDI